jgi:hypothetical protein
MHTTTQTNPARFAFIYIDLAVNLLQVVKNVVLFSAYFSYFEKIKGIS